MKRVFSPDNFIRIIFFVFLVWLPFNTKKFFYAFWTGSVSEITSVFLYVSDLLLILLIISVAWRFIKNKEHLLWDSVKVIFTIFLALVAFSVVFASFKLLALYQFVHLIEAVALAWTLGYLLTCGLIKTKEIIGFLGADALFQALIAFAQFKFQHSLGLIFWGESLAGPFVPGVSSVFVAGGHLIRAYGTLPHANILAAFLVLGLLSFCYFYLIVQKREGRILLAIAIFFTGLGLVFTFSRSGWLTAFIALTAFIVWTASQNIYRHQAINLAVILGVCLLLFLATMSWAIFPRARLVIDSAINDRLIYNQMGLALLWGQPWGVGIGNELMFGISHKLFQNYGLTSPGRWQPIHNLYLLMAVEAGILMLAFFVFFVLKVLIRGFKQSKNNVVVILVIVLLLTLLIDAFSDHFLWDLQNGRLMFWLIIGILLGITSRRSMDRTSPSEGEDAGSIPAERTNGRENF